MPQATIPQATIRENRIVSGMLPGFNQPVALITLSLEPALLQSGRLPLFDGGLGESLPGFVASLQGKTLTWEHVAHWFLRLDEALQQAAYYPCLQQAKAVVLPESDAGRQLVQLYIPVLGPQHSAVNKYMHQLIKLLDEQLPCSQALVSRWVNDTLELLRYQFPAGAGGANMLRFAAARQIPWLHMVNNLFQYGWGKNSRLLDGTFTDATPNISTRLVRHKLSAALLLRNAGLPVPKHVVVHSLQEVEANAERMAYPLVIKPLDQDGGVGVTAGITTLAVLRTAYGKALVHSKKILLEQHQPGRDYRVYVMNGEVLHVYNRIAANITGDGKATVTELLARLNEDPRRQPAAGRLKQVLLDEEALELLAAAGLQAHSIPGKGHNISLRRSPNVNTGGEVVKMELAQVHPDNLALCVRAVRILRMDLAGVDLLIPDISVSWLESGAGICEVNAQPAIPPVVAEDILGRLIQGNGRIPMITVVENRERVAWLDDVSKALQERNICVGLASSYGVYINQQLVAQAAADAPSTVAMLLRDTSIDIIFVMISAADLLRHGLHCDRMDLLLLSGITGITGPLQELAHELTARTETVWINTDSPVWKQASTYLTTASLLAEQQLKQHLLDFVERSL